MTAPSFDAFTLLMDPHPFLRHARDQAPVFHDPATGYWVVSRYDTIKELLSDPETFSSVNALDPITPLDSQVPAILEAGHFGARPFIVNIDGDDHLERKRIFTSVLHPRKVKQCIVLEELTTLMPDLQLIADRPSTYIRNVSFCGPRTLWLQHSASSLQ